MHNPSLRQHHGAHQRWFLAQQSVLSDSQRRDVQRYVQIGLFWRPIRHVHQRDVVGSGRVLLAAE